MIEPRTLDRIVLRLLDGLEIDNPDVEHDVERLIRMGVHGEKSTEQACKRLGVDPSNLADRLRRRAVPSPRDLIAWGRLLAAMHAWEPAGEGRKIAPKSLEQVALVLKGS